jgi:peptide subunit release factor RF-3
MATKQDKPFRPPLTLILLTTTIVALPSNAIKWQMGFNSAFKGLKNIHSLQLIFGWRIL